MVHCESRRTADRSGGQCGPSIRPTIHSSGRIYAAYFNWSAFTGSIVTADVVVCRDDNWGSRNPLGRVGEHGEFANLASFLISDSAGYINGEMVVQDGGAHLRSSGAEDLLAWTEAQWEAQRMARSKDRT